MKVFNLYLLLIVLIPAAVYSQRNTDVAIDTLETINGPVVLYKNFTWEYLQDEPLMMHPADDSTGIFSDGWNNNQTFSFPVRADDVKDTLLVLTSGDRKFTMPVCGKLFRGFMYMHKGLDIDLKKGDTVRAAFDGVVRYAKYNRGGFGNLVIMRHYNGLETYYAHLSKINVRINQVIKSGDPIALGGSTGRSRGPHLHFEIRYKDVPLDPLLMIDYDNNKLLTNSFQITRKAFYPKDFNGNAVYHKIRSGDTLGSIARKYRTSIRNICAMNRLKTTSTLKLGRSIRVR